jgi:HKD family nuclease
MMNNEVLNLAEKLCTDLEKNYREYSPNSVIGRKFHIEAGRKYLKVVMTDGNGTSASVHAFVDKSNGDLYKAASWNAPAKGVRFNLLTNYPVLTGADWAGGYLYIR